MAMPECSLSTTRPLGPSHCQLLCGSLSSLHLPGDLPKTEKESVHLKTGLNFLEKANKGIDFTTQPVTRELVVKEALQTGIEVNAESQSRGSSPAAANRPLVTLHSLPWSLFRVQ